MKSQSQSFARRVLIGAAVSFGYLCAALAFTVPSQAEPQPAEVSCFDAAFGAPCRGAPSIKSPIKGAERASSHDFDLKAWAAAQER